MLTYGSNTDNLLPFILGYVSLVPQHGAATSAAWTGCYFSKVSSKLSFTIRTVLTTYLSIRKCKLNNCIFRLVGQYITIFLPGIFVSI